MKECKPVQTRLDKVIEWLGEKLSLLFLFIVAISFYEVIMRYFFTATTWVHELASHLGACLFVFGGAYALATDKHVRVVLVYDNVSAKTKAYLNVFHHLMGIVFSVMMAWASYILAKEAWFAPWGALRLQTTGSAWDSRAIAYLKALIFVTMIVLTIQFTLHLIAELRRLFSGYYNSTEEADHV